MGLGRLTGHNSLVRRASATRLRLARLAWGCGVSCRQRTRSAAEGSVLADSDSNAGRALGAARCFAKSSRREATFTSNLPDRERLRLLARWARLTKGIVAWAPEGELGYGPQAPWETWSMCRSSRRLTVRETHHCAATVGAETAELAEAIAELAANAGWLLRQLRAARRARGPAGPERARPRARRRRA